MKKQGYVWVCSTCRCPNALTNSVCIACRNPKSITNDQYSEVVSADVNTKNDNKEIVLTRLA